MSKKVIIRGHKRHNDHFNALARFYNKERGSDQGKKDSRLVPRTTNRDVRELATWWNREYKRGRKSKPWHRHEAQERWEQDLRRIERDLEGAKPDQLYRDNAWFWYSALIKLAIYLTVLKTIPSPTELFIEALKETVEERVEDAHELIQGAGKAASDAVKAAGKAAEAVADAGSRAWSGMKIAAIIGGSLLGAAVILPPVIRAFREEPQRSVNE